jgi:hypothetical protein
MVVYHVFKADCFGSSRVMTQTTWDDKSIFIHSSEAKPSKHGKPDIASIKLNLFAIAWHVLKANPNQNSTFIFHAQSSLPYLLFSSWLCFLTARRLPLLVYDMHDLLEKRDSYHSWWNYLRYGLLRHQLLRLLEKSIFQHSGIRKVTVSDGLAELVSQRYRCPIPAVVRSVPQPIYAAQNFPLENMGKSLTLLWDKKNMFQFVL